MFECLPPLHYADALGGIPLFSLLEEIGGSVPDAVLLALMLGMFWWIRSTINSVRKGFTDAMSGIKSEWKEQSDLLRKQGEDQFRNLQEEWESTFSILRSGMKESLSQVAKINDDHLSGIKELLRELKDGKAWTNECELKHRMLEEKNKAFEERLREGNDRFRDLERELRELRK
jgi:predicted RNase H-like nuclease (RuvC/YqgF family)